MAKRIGLRMQDVAKYVRMNPGQPMIRAAEYVAPRGSLRFGYRTVHRAIAAGLVIATPGPRNSWLLEVPS